MHETKIAVAVRVRPQSETEKSEGQVIVTEAHSSISQISVGKDRSFTFDHVFDLHSNQNSIFSTVVEPLIEGCLDGYNATVLAYGQTGSGKTYTMGTIHDSDATSSLGRVTKELGIIPRAVNFLFKKFHQRKLDAQSVGEKPPDVKVEVQFIELYNEEIRDLLQIPKFLKSVRIQDDTKGGICLTGVSTRQVHGPSDTLRCLKDGTELRTTAATNMNSQSSRSHAVFTLYVEQKLVRKASGQVERRFAKLHFVDLAGSERLGRTGATGERAREGININIGLLALGNVISALADRSRHVPYRDAKLTRLLADSLGGNSRTAMIACVSPSQKDWSETLNTLQYANRVKKIRNQVVANLQCDQSQGDVEQLRAQVELLKTEIKNYSQPEPVCDLGPVEKIFSDRSSLLAEQNACDSSMKELDLRIMSRRGLLERLAAFKNEHQNARVFSHDDSSIRGLEQTCRNLQKKHKALTGDLQENDKKLRQVYNEKMDIAKSKSQKELLTTILRSKHTTTQLEESRRKEGHLNRLIDHMQEEMNSHNQLLESLLTLVDKQRKLLTRHGLDTDLQADYRTLANDMETLLTKTAFSVNEDCTAEIPVTHEGVDEFMHVFTKHSDAELQHAPDVPPPVTPAQRPRKVANRTVTRKRKAPDDPPVWPHSGANEMCTPSKYPRTRRSHVIAKKADVSMETVEEECKRTFVNSRTVTKAKPPRSEQTMDISIPILRLDGGENKMARDDNVVWENGLPLPVVSSPPQSRPVLADCHPNVPPAPPRLTRASAARMAYVTARKKSRLSNIPIMKMFPQTTYEENKPSSQTQRVTRKSIVDKLNKFGIPSMFQSGASAMF